ncbi:SWIRM domain-containing protein [Plectosphaerella plurivora]|uniref:SWIRM domain-containing protein n=1 Tax=Plectosphaerella plurivora TaxID=936078 RepID=A0A9P9ADT4_9PEZI|nr:SWIRM domain-containing protein [Plectosphaerella plurivora]
MEANRLTSRQTPGAIGPSASAGKKPAAFDFTSLMSPPDQIPFDNFNHHAGQSDAADPTTIIARAGESSINLKEARPRMPMSPPVSPQTQAQAAADAVDATPLTTHAIKDPILYPRDDVVPSPPQQPLFPASESVQHRRLVSEHIAHRDATQFRSSEPPRPEEYELALQVKSQVLKMYSRDRRSWMQKERELLVNDRKMNHDRWNNKRYTPIAPARIAAKTSSASRVPKPVKTPTAKPDRVVKPSPARIPGPTVRNPVRPQSSPKGRLNSVTPEPGRRVVAPNREDRDFNALEDLCPPLDSLPNKPNSLKVDWKGSPVNLSQDPHAHLLHPDELSLAANLRLDCATYLTSKRRIFIRRRACAVQGKEFRKTDAQQACKIDVNKASKLWTAFEKVGWLDMHWIRNFM